MSEKAIVAMSGGVDSSVAAYFAKKEGMDVIGVTLRLFENETAGISCEKSCCSLSDVEDARSAALKLDIPYYVFNYTEDFSRQVIDRFIAAYERGETPNPCIDCNRYIKFSQLFVRGKELGRDSIITGHYSRIEKDGSGRYLLNKGLDPTKDQSYVLYAMTQEQLAHTRFPLGGLVKSETREIAEELGLRNAAKRDSQDICFAPDGDYVGFIERYTGKVYEPGDFVDEQGRVLGQHRGIIGYTVGQRKGLGIAAGKPVYVTKICPAENRVILGDNEDLFHRELDAEDFNFISFDTPPAEFRAKAKVRYRQKEQWATVKVTGEHSVHIIFDEPQRAITKGQAAVLYDGDVVIGGGVITG